LELGSWVGSLGLFFLLFNVAASAHMATGTGTRSAHLMIGRIHCDISLELLFSDIMKPTFTNPLHFFSLFLFTADY
jgi:hypothetical protein